MSLWVDADFLSDFKLQDTRVATNQPTTNPALEVGWLAR